MKHEKWTIDSIDKLRELYKNGYSLKAMARALGKTATGINKALTRFEIRPYFQRKSPKVKKRLGLVKLPAPPVQRKLPDSWVTLEEALRWLASHGVNIHVTHCPVSYRSFYTYGSARLTDGGVVIEFNRKRLQLGLETLWVKDVSWE